MENEQIHAGGICHALVGVGTGRMERNQAGEVDRTQNTGGLLTSFLHVIPCRLTVVGGAQKKRMVHWRLSVCVSSLSPRPPESSLGNLLSLYQELSSFLVFLA